MTNPDYTALCAELAKLARRNHYTCEDAWYSCPKSPDGCANDAAGDECDCGADSHNDKIDELLSRAARRPKPPSLKEQGLQALGRFNANAHTTAGEMTADFELLRRAVEQLPNG